jgi:ParB-like chromosome segregation protein Spo0J
VIAPVLTQPTGTYLAAIPTHQLVEPPDNPNRMSEVTFHRLRRAIGQEGFNTTIVVRDLGGGLFEIIDGCHRLQAARDLGLAEVAAWVYPEGTCSDAKAKALQIGFNAITGEPDLTAVAKAMDEYGLLDSGLVELAGYGLADAEALIAALKPVDLDDLDSPAIPSQVDNEEGAGPAPVFELTLAFRSREELATAKRVLRKAAPGKSKDLAEGFMRLAGLDA